jgi:hypothetical protein
VRAGSQRAEGRLALRVFVMKGIKSFDFCSTFSKKVRKKKRGSDERPLHTCDKMLKRNHTPAHTQNNIHPKYITQHSPHQAKLINYD